MLVARERTHRQVIDRARGFTLVESLIALLVLSLGLLGIAAMQLKGLQSAHLAYQGSLASLAATDAQERVWTYLANHQRHCPGAAALISISAGWQAQWLEEERHDTGSSGIFQRAPCEYEVLVELAVGRDGANSEAFRYRFRLPELH